MEPKNATLSWAVMVGCAGSRTGRMLMLPLCSSRDLAFVRDILQVTTRFGTGGRVFESRLPDHLSHSGLEIADQRFAVSNMSPKLPVLRRHRASPTGRMSRVSAHLRQPRETKSLMRAS